MNFTFAGCPVSGDGKPSHDVASMFGLLFAAGVENVRYV